MITELLNSLNRVSSASRVWAHYVGLLNVLRNEKLPVEVHQEVLRKCTPKTAEVRLAAARRSALDARLKFPHLQEGRFRTVIRNIRAMGETPALQDYHFILEQFAAVGHYREPWRYTRSCRWSGHIGLGGLRTNTEARLWDRFEQPDRPVLEYLHDPSTVADPLFTKLPGPQRFTTAGLNTVVDLLGRLGEVSKMVQTFESWPPLLARHYILQAMQLDRERIAKSVDSLHTDCLQSRSVLHFAINRGTLIPVLGEANRDKNVGLIRWLQSKLPKILRRKRNDLAFYSAYRDQLIEEPAVEPSSEHDVSSSETGEPLLATREAVESAGSSSRGSTSADSAESRDKLTSVIDATLDLSRQGDHQQTPWKDLLPRQLSSFRRPLNHPLPPFLTWTSMLPSCRPPIVKYFNIDLHLQVLARDIREIEEFSVVVENTLGRITQRLKERLGRRVWSSKDIWLRSVNRRMQVNKSSFVAEVNYRPKSKRKR
ncbi:FAD-binding monooxygenase [Salix suchowensis]|nr:FAD-binding monooxygenase [Salix suchowensis]